VVVVLLAGAGFVSWAWEPAIALSPAPDQDSFDPKLKNRGAELARIGNCNVCHAGRDGAFAGGRAMRTRPRPQLPTRLPMRSARACASSR
jgi:mono/diheme cytochrome c family protein